MPDWQSLWARQTNKIPKAIIGHPRPPPAGAGHLRPPPATQLTIFRPCHYGPAGADLRPDSARYLPAKVDVAGRAGQPVRSAVVGVVRECARRRIDSSNNYIATTSQIDHPGLPYTWMNGIQPK